MKKLFISQPMRGKTDEEILREREQAVAMAEAALGEKVEVIDSFFQGAPADAKPLWFLGKSLEMMAEADVAYFAPGWKDARGCRIEYMSAIEYGIPVIEEQGMSFGQALIALKAGKKLAREGWNGKGLFVYFVSAGRYPAKMAVAHELAGDDGCVAYEPYFAIKNIKGTVSTWVPSINDCLAEDWRVVE